MKYIRYIIAIVTIIYGTACQTDTTIYEQSQTLPQGNWPMTQAAVFAPNISDTTANYKLYFRIRNGEYYAYSNIWLFCKTTTPQGHSHIDTVEIYLANQQGKWLGKQQSDSFVGLYNYKANAKFAKAGKYKIQVLQGMRHQSLAHIQEIGLLIEKTR